MQFLEMTIYTNLAMPYQHSRAKTARPLLNLTLAFLRYLNHNLAPRFSSSKRLQRSWNPFQSNELFVREAGASELTRFH